MSVFQIYKEPTKSTKKLILEEAQKQIYRSGGESDDGETPEDKKRDSVSLTSLDYNNAVFPNGSNNNSMIENFDN